MAIGANLPDVDLVTRFAGSTVFLKYHRGITHSILGVSVLAALLAGTFFLLGRRAQPAKNSPPLDGRWLLAGCWLATASHLLLDFTNSYGVRPFLPFSGKWYAWDIVFIVDPVLLGLMGAGLGLPMVLRIDDEDDVPGVPLSAEREERPDAVRVREIEQKMAGGSQPAPRQQPATVKRGRIFRGLRPTSEQKERAGQKGGEHRNTQD